MIRLLIADDHPLIGQGISMALKSTDITVVGSVQVAQEVRPEYLKLQPDVLLCDIRFGDELHGLDLIQDLLTADPNAKVIFFSQFDQDKMIKEAYGRGAKAFLSKSTSSEELISAIQKVAKGDLYFTPENALKLVTLQYDQKDDDRKIDEILTEKEIEVFRLLADGLTEQETATQLQLSKKTITNIKASIKEKLQISRVTEMTKIALKNNLIEWDD